MQNNIKIILVLGITILAVMLLDTPTKAKHFAEKQVIVEFLNNTQEKINLCK